MEISEETKKIEKALDENIIKLIDDVNSVWKQSNYKYQLSKELPKTTFKKSELIKGRSWGGGEYSFDTIRLGVGDNGINICVLNGEYYHASKGIWKNDNSLSYSKGGHDSISTNNIDFKFFLAANADVILNNTTELTNEYLQKQQIAAEKKVQETKAFEEHSKALAEELGIEPEPKFLEYKAKLENFDKNNKSRLLQKMVEYSLDAKVIELPEVEYTRDNYNKYFSRGQIESPVESLKMGGGQFEKFGKEDRNNLMKAAYLTLTKPSVVIEKDSYDKYSDTFKPLHVYGKSFYRTESGNKRVVEAVVVFKDENNIVIGSHNNDIDNFVKQIKTADQLIYVDPEISRMITQLNKEVGNPVSLYGLNTEALNQKYDKNLDVSTIESLPLSKNTEVPENQDIPSVIVEGKRYELPNGIENGLVNAIKQNSELIKDYNELTREFNSLADENDKLRQQLQNQNHDNKPSSYS